MQSKNLHPIILPTPTCTKKGLGNVLLCCYFEPFGISTIYENIAYLQKKSEYSIDVCNFYGQQSPFKISERYDLKEYDAIIFHNTVTFSIDCLSEVDHDTKISLKDFDGVKVLFKQDEHYRTSEVAEFIKDTDIDVVFTLVEEKYLELFYPKEIVGDVRFVHMLTGYVMPWMRSKLDWKRIEDQTIDIGYRGSIQPLHFGRLAYEKKTIGDVVESFYSETSISTDITSKWERRLNGEKWIEFLRNSKITLGVESGASIVDFDGKIEKHYNSILSRLGKHYESHAWCEEVLSELAIYENNGYYKTISPRHLEASACGSVQLLYEGDYMGILLPDIHYIPLKRSIDALKDIKEILCDVNKLSKIREACFEDVINNPKYWIEAFVTQFDSVLEKEINNKGYKPRRISYSTGINNLNVLLLCAHRPSKDPRIGWIADHAPDNIKIHVVGLEDSDYTRLDICEKSNNQYQITHYRYRFPDNWMSGLFYKNKISIIASFISVLRSLEQSTDNELFRLVGAENVNTRIHQFRAVLRYFLGSNSTLFELGSLFTNIDAIIAADLETLPAGILLKEYFGGVPLIYDAHEYWAESNLDHASWEINFWSDFERSLLKYSDFRVTVSSHLATLMTKSYGYDFEFLPNCEPRCSVDAIIPRYSPMREDIIKNNTDEIQFVYQGGFAKGRGLELLIRAWKKTDRRAILIIRGPENSEYCEILKSLAKDLELLGNRIIFASSVKESELIAAASDADVGIIPYEPIGTNNLYCCPNKLSQYCGAGLPILSNETEFLKEIIEKNRLGTVVNFVDEDSLVTAINYFIVNLKFRTECGNRAREFFENEFNWNLQSDFFYKNILVSIQQHQSRYSGIFGYKKNEIFDINLRNPNQKLILTVPTKFFDNSFDNSKALTRTKMITGILFSIARNITIKIGMFTIFQRIWRLLPLSVRKLLK